MRNWLIALFVCICVLLLAQSPPEALGEEGTFQMPSGLLLIEEEAFLETGASEVILSEDLIVIGDRAFAEMKNLQVAYLPESQIQMGSDVFAGNPELAISGIPDGWAEEYARRNHFQFIWAVSILPVHTEGLGKALSLMVLCFTILFCTYRVLCFIRKNDDNNSIKDPKKSGAMHATELCFP